MAADAMDEILMLQRELAAVQEEDTTHRLSERNCVEIVMKLQELGLLQVIYTCNAKEFLTPEQLKREIQDELLAAGGRVFMGDLQPVLNVDAFHVDKAAAELAAEDPSLLLLNGELVAAWHLDGLVEEAGVALQDKGKIGLAALAAQFNLPVPVTERAVKDRLGTPTLLRAKLRGGVLYTEAFERTQAARARGVCAGITRPVTIPQLLADHPDLDESILLETLAELIKAQTIPGTLRGREFIPAAFSRTQRACVDAFFAQNGYLEFARAQRLKIHRPLDFLRHSFPDVFAVDNRLVLSAATLHDLEANVEEAVQARSWLDVTSVLPPALSAADGAALLAQHCRPVGSGAEQPALALAGVYAVSKAWLQDAGKELLAPLAAERAGEAAAVGGVGGIREGEDAGGGGRGRGRRAGGGGGRRKGSDGAGGGGGGLGEEEVEAALLGWGRASDTGLAEHPELVQALVGELMPEARRLYEGALAAALSSMTSQQGDAAARRREQRAFEEQLEAASMTLQLLARGIEALLPSFASEGDRRDVTTFLLRSRGGQLADLVTARAAGEYEVPYAVAGSSLPCQPSITLEQRNVLKQQLPKPVGDAVVRLWTLAVKGKGGLGDVLECLEAHVAPAMDALFRKLDRKREKALVFQRRMELLAQLHASESPAEILVAAQQLRLIQVKGAVLLPSAAEADAALATSVPHLLALLGRTAAAAAAASASEAVGEEGEAAGVGGVVGALEGAWAAYSAAEGDAEERGRLAQELLAAQAAVKEAFAKKDGAGGGGR